MENTVYTNDKNTGMKKSCSLCYGTSFEIYLYDYAWSTLIVKCTGLKIHRSTLMSDEKQHLIPKTKWSFFDFLTTFMNCVQR